MLLEARLTFPPSVTIISLVSMYNVLGKILKWKIRSWRPEMPLVTSNEKESELCKKLSVMTTDSRKAKPLTKICTCMGYATNCAGPGIQ